MSLNTLPPDSPSRLAAFIRLTERQPKPLVALVGGSAISLLALLDYWLTVRHIALSIYYLIPIVGLAWFLGWRAGVIATLVSALVNLVIDVVDSASLVNHILSLLYFAIICLGTARAISAVRVMLSYYYRGETWRGLFSKPVRIGERFIIAPAGQTVQPADSSTLPIYIEPGMAFGTGTHPTTQMCIGLLETCLAPGNCVLDLGCGTGILSIAAAKLGAVSVLGVDIVPESVHTARHNAALNNLTDRIEFIIGSLDTVLHPDNPLPITHYQIIVANVLTPVLLDFFEQGLAATLALGGTLILSGIRAEEAAVMRDALATAGLKLVEQRDSTGWVAMAARAD